MSNPAITDDTTLSSAATSETQDAQPTVPETQIEGQTGSTVPEKFVGKSPMEIIEAYNNLERHASKVSSERAEERKNREQLEARLSAMETELRSRPQQVVQHVPPPAPEKDPFSEYEESFESDPKQAIKGLVAKTRAQLEQELKQREFESSRSEAERFYLEQKRDNPEYAKLEPTMQQLALEYKDLMEPGKVASVKMLKLLHLAAKGARVDDYVKDAATKAKSETATIREEKRNAFSESSGTKGSSSRNFSDLSVEEMEKMLGYDRK